MLVKLDNPVLLSKTIEIISELVTDVRIKINEFGMSVVAMDPANVSMVSFKIPKTSFSQFELRNNSGEVLGVSLDSLKRILKRCGTTSSLILESKDNVLNFLIQDKIKRNFSLILIEIDSEDKELPNLEFSSIIEINSNDFIASVEDCVVVADACSFEVKEVDGVKKFLIHAKGMNSTLSEFSGDEAKIDAEECRAKYSLEYLQKFMKASKLSEKTTLKFANDHPLRMDIKEQGIDLSFILAPRVETED